MAWPYMFDPEDPEYDPLSPYQREEPPPQMPPPVDIPEEEPPTTAPEDTVYPSHVLPFQSLPSPALEEYKAHISTQPTREGNEAKWWEKLGGILAGGAASFAAGGRTEPGMQLFNMVNENRFNRAKEDWATKEASLKAAAQQEGKTLGESVDYRLGQIKDETARANLGARMDQIKKNYEVGMKNAKTAAERVAVQKAAQEEAAKFHQELIGVRKTEAGAAVTRAGAAVTSANAAKTRAEKSTQPKTMSSLDQLRVNRLAQDAVMAELPEAQKFIETDDNGKITGWKNAPEGGWFSKAGWSAEDAIARAKVIKRYNELRAEALKELNTRNITEEPPPYIPE